MTSHQFSIIDQFHHSEQHNGKQQSINHLSYQQHSDQWQIWNYGDRRTYGNEKSKRTEKDWRFTKTSGYAFLEAECFTDRIGGRERQNTGGKHRRAEESDCKKSLRVSSGERL